MNGPRGTWRTTLLLREAAKNLWGGSRLTLTLVIAVALSIASVILLRAELSSFLAAQLDRAPSGTYVLAISSLDQADPIKIERESCDRLASDPRVDLAGVMKADGTTYIRQFARNVSIIRASHTLIPDAYRLDGVLGAAFAKPGSVTAVVVQDYRLVMGTLVEQPRGVDVNSAVVLPMSPVDHWADICIVVGKSGVSMDELASQSLASVQTHGGHPVARLQVQPWVDHVGVYIARLGRVIVLAAGILAGLLVGLTARWRASEIAVYRLAGASRRSVAGLLACEAGLMATIYLAVGMTTAVLLAPGLTSMPGWTIGLIGSSAAVFGVGWALAVPVVFADATRLLTDR